MRQGKHRIVRGNHYVNFLCGAMNLEQTATVYGIAQLGGRQIIAHPFALGFIKGRNQDVLELPSALFNVIGSQIAARMYRGSILEMTGRLTHHNPRLSLWQIRLLSAVTYFESAPIGSHPLLHPARIPTHLSSEAAACRVAYKPDQWHL